MRRRIVGGVALGILAGLLSGWPEAAAERNTPLLIADFNFPQQNSLFRNALGGSFQPWMLMQDCWIRQAFLQEDALSGDGGEALQLTYSLDAVPYFNGWSMFLSADERGAIDLRGYDRLGFFARGTTGFVIEVKDRTSRDDGSPEGVAQHTVERLPSDWRQIEVRFDQFEPKRPAGRIDWAGIRQLVIVFSDLRSAREGYVVLDQLYVSRGPAAFRAPDEGMTLAGQDAP